MKGEHNIEDFAAFGCLFLLVNTAEAFLPSIGIKPNFFNVMISILIFGIFVVPLVRLIWNVMWKHVIPNILLFVLENKIFFLLVMTFIFIVYKLST